jgi:hypothetical protein
MTTGHAILVVAAVSTGLITGLLMTTLAFFQRTLKDLTTPEFALVMRHFLGVARTHPLNYGLVTASLLATIVALVLLRGSAGGPEFVLVLASLLAFVAGSVLVLQFFARSLYNVYLGWRVESPPEGWQRARVSYFRLNVVQGLSPGVAFVRFWSACPWPNWRRCSDEHRSDGA